MSTKLDYNIVADSIRLTREKKGVTISQLARLSGIGHATISEIESGNIKNPSLGSVTKIAEALGVSIDSLVYGKHDKNYKPNKPPQNRKMFFRKYENITDETKKALEKILDELDRK